MPSIVSTAEPIYCGSPEPTGNIFGSKIISSGFMPYLSVKQDHRNVSPLPSSLHAITACPRSSIRIHNNGMPHSDESAVQSLRISSSPSSKINRVNNRFTLRIFKSKLDNMIIGGVNHQRNFDFLHNLLQEFFIPHKLHQYPYPAG